MKVTSRDILEILKTARELGYREFRLEHEGLQLSASTTARGAESIGSLAGSSAPAQASAPPAPLPQTAASAMAPAPLAPLAPVSREGLVAITAPMSGTFYRSPSPGDPPFVEVGSRVNASDVVCIVEVMKLFNSIRAGTVGVIAEITTDNESAVVAGQPVIWIKPTKG